MTPNSSLASPEIVDILGDPVTAHSQPADNPTDPNLDGDHAQQLPNRDVSAANRLVAPSAHVDETSRSYVLLPVMRCGGP